LDSAPMLMMRYRPSIVAPSGPYDTCPAASLRIAIFWPPRSSVPMNFNGIGGTGGGGGGPGGTVLTGGGGGGFGAGGGAFGLNRNRFRSLPPGFGRLPSSASRCTSGAAGRACAPAPTCPVEPAAAPPSLDVCAGVADVAVHARYATRARIASSAASSHCRRRSVAIGSQSEVSRQLERQRERLARLVLREGDVVDD